MCSCEQEFSGFRRGAPGYPPPEFRGHTQRAARPVPAGRSRGQMTPPRGLLGDGQPQRPSRAVLASWQGLHAAPSCPRPRTASGRLGAARHGRPPSPARRGPGPRHGSTQRMTRQERGPGPAPAGTVAPARRARPLPVQLPLHLRRAAHPAGRCTGGFEGNGGSSKAKTRRGSPGRAVETHSSSLCQETTCCDGECQSTARCGVSSG